MATIPRINEANEIVGETTLQEARENGWPRRVARLLIFDTTGKHVLLQKRSMQVRTAPGKWDSSGGHVDYGETYAEAAGREVREELGVNVAPTEVTEPVFFQNTFYVVCRATADRSVEFVLKKDEVEETSWVSVEAFSSEMQQNTEAYTPWLVDAWERFHDKLISDL